MAGYVTDIEEKTLKNSNFREVLFTTSRSQLVVMSLKPGEDPDKAAMRECHEETGLVPERLERLGAFYPTPGYCDELMNFYRATELREPNPGEDAHQDEDEDIEARPAFAVAVGAQPSVLTPAA